MRRAVLRWARMRAMTDVSRAEFEALQRQVTTHIETAHQPSLQLVLGQVAAERDAINAHSDSLGTKAGIVLGFSGVLIGVSGTAPRPDFGAVPFQAALCAAALAAVLAGLALSPVLIWRRRNRPQPLDLGAYNGKTGCPEADTRKDLLADQIAMVEKTRTFAKRKEVLVFLSVVFLAAAAGLMVTGALEAQAML